jgi:hypothetical protein
MAGMTSIQPPNIQLSPTGRWNDVSGYDATGWSSGDNRAKRWTYFWLSIIERNLSAAAYEVLRDGIVVVQRTKLLKPPELFAITGFVDEEPDDPSLQPIGGAAKLDAGIYAVDFYVTVAQTEHLLRGVRFEVAERGTKKGYGGRQIKTPLPIQVEGATTKNNS